MKIKTSFFWHLFSETAIRNGWDFEEDFDIFVLKMKDEVLDLVAFTAYGNDLTERDIYTASKGIATDNFIKFYKTIYDNCKNDSSHKCVHASMHSGSSDYLFVSDLEQMFGEIK